MFHCQLWKTQARRFKSAGRCICEGVARSVLMDRILSVDNSGVWEKPVRTSRGCTVFLCLFVCLLFALPSFAQRLTPAQTAELKFLLKLESRLSPLQQQLL